LKMATGATGAILLLAIGGLVMFYLSGRTIPGVRVQRDERGKLMSDYDGQYGQGQKWDGGDNPTTETNNADSAEHYFTLTTDFMEWGWGDAIHMAPMHPDHTFKVSMNLWEYWFAQRIGIKEGLQVADLGMGIGGPMRRISSFYGCNVTGVTICSHQIDRANALTPDHLKGKVHYVQADYSDTGLPSNSFDVVYFMESLSHCEHREKPLAEAYRLLKPGGVVGAWQWMLKPGFDYKNTHHMELKRGMEYGGGLRNLNLPEERKDEFRLAGFTEFEESRDQMDIASAKGWTTWISPISDGHDLFTKFASSSWGRQITSAFVWVIEKLGIAEEGTFKISRMMEHCAVCAAKAGEEGVFTPLWLTIARKPL